MILILSVSNDISTTQVIEWLCFKNINFKRLNTNQPYEVTVDNEIDIDGININFFSSYWYRRGRLKINRYSFAFIEPTISHYLNENDYKILELIEYKLAKKKHINTYFNSLANKLIILEKAKNLKLQVPTSFLLQKTPLGSEKYIYKTINETGFISLKYSDFFAATKELKDLNPERFDTTLFQELIEKKYELRVFYLAGKFWSMAIFSQNSEKTTVDFRNYNYEKPNRTVPYKLPISIEKKLDTLMKMQRWNCGSIDMIVSTDDEYYFLEINPVGQFGMVSFPCNYNLEEKIAEYLNYE